MTKITEYTNNIRHFCKNVPYKKGKSQTRTSFVSRSYLKSLYIVFKQTSNLYYGDIKKKILKKLEKVTLLFIKSFYVLRSFRYVL